MCITLAIVCSVVSCVLMVIGKNACFSHYIGDTLMAVALSTYVPQAPMGQPRSGKWKSRGK